MNEIEQLRTNLSAVRNRLGKSQGSIGELIGASQSTVSRFEDGKTDGTAALRRQISQFIETNSQIQTNENCGAGNSPAASS